MKITNSLAFSVERNSRRTLTSNNYTEKNDSEKIKQYLKDHYPHIQFEFSEVTGSIENYADAKKGTGYIVISPEFLEKQTFEEFTEKTVKKLSDLLEKYQKSAQKEAWMTGKKVKGTGLVVDKEGKVSAWVSFDGQQEKQKSELERYLELFKQQENQLNPYERIRQKMMKSYKCSYSANMMRLASAKNEFAVRSLIAEKYGELSKVRMEITDQNEAAKLIRKIKKVIQQGNLKIARLHKEEKIEQRRKAAEKECKRREEERLREEVRKKRVARRAQERCQTIDMMDIFPEGKTARKHYTQLPGEYIPVDGAVLSGGTEFLGQGAGAAGGGMVEVHPSVDVLV